MLFGWIFHEKLTIILGKCEMEKVFLVKKWRVFIDEEVCPTNFKQFPKITKFQVFKGIFIARRKTLPLGLHNYLKKICHI